MQHTVLSVKKLPYRFLIPKYSDAEKKIFFLRLRSAVIRRFRIIISFLVLHSVRNDFTGLAIAAFID